MQIAAAASVPTRHAIRVFGHTGSLVLGGLSTAAVLGAWSIRNGTPGVWHLHASVVRIDRFLIRQRGLGFTAPKARGFWWWPVLDLVIDDAARTVRATLKPPEQ